MVGDLSVEGAANSAKMGVTALGNEKHHVEPHGPPCGLLPLLTVGMNMCTGACTMLESEMNRVARSATVGQSMKFDGQRKDRRVVRSCGTESLALQRYTLTEVWKQGILDTSSFGPRLRKPLIICQEGMT